MLDKRRSEVVWRVLTTHSIRQFPLHFPSRASPCATRFQTSYTTADGHTSAANCRQKWRPRRFKWTRPFSRRTKSGFCGCAITFQTQSARNIPGGKVGRCMRLTTSPPSRAECHQIREPKLPGTFWATLGLLRDCFTFYDIDVELWDDVNKCYVG